MADTSTSTDQQQQGKQPRESGGLSSVGGMTVAVAGLAALIAIVGIAILALPDDDGKGQNIVAISSAAFGVIGAITGAYFGIRSALSAVDKTTEATTTGAARPGEPGAGSGEAAPGSGAGPRRPSA